MHVVLSGSDDLEIKWKHQAIKYYSFLHFFISSFLPFRIYFINYIRVLSIQIIYVLPWLRRRLIEHDDCSVSITDSSSKKR